MRVFSDFKSLGASLLVASFVTLYGPSLQAAPAAEPKALVAVSTPKTPTKSTPVAAEVFASGTRTVSGFRMEGAPEIEVVFGDIADYKRHIDNSRSLRKQMSEQRERFATASHAAQTLFSKTRRGCPVDSLAPHYAVASESGLRFRDLGRSLETTHFAIKNLDELGESTGLTPDYRWQVKRGRGQYLQALTDLREMRAVFRGQIQTEVRARKCDSQELLARAKTLKTEVAPHTKVTTQPVPATKSPTIIPASTATFFVDNTACADELAVSVDGILLGRVAPGTRAAFQSLMGRHTLCLLGETDTAECGESGTQRSAFVYDRWSVSRHCNQ